MIAKEERKFYDLLDRLSEAELNKIIEDVEKTCDIEDISLSDKEINRIKNKTYKKIGVKPIKKRTNKKVLKVASITILSLAVVTTITSRDSVRATVKNGLSYIYGLNKVIESEKTEGEYVLKSIVKKKVNKGYVKLREAYVSDNKVMIYLEGEKTYPPNSYTIDILNNKGITDKKILPIEPILIDNKGNKYKLDPTSGAGSGLGAEENGNWYMEYEYDNKIESLRGLKVDIGYITIPIELKPVEKIRNYDDIGFSDTKNDIKVTAVPIFEEDKLKMNFLLTTKLPLEIESYGSKGIEIEDDKGNLYKGKPYVFKGLLRPNRSSQYFDIKKGAKGNLNVRLPNMVVAYKINEKIEIEIPKEGSINLDKTIKVHEHKINFYKAEILNDDSNSKIIRVYVNNIYSKESKEKILSLHFNNIDRWSDGADPKTEELKYIDIELKNQTNNMTLDISGARVEVKGPWYFNIPLEKIK